MQRSQAPALSGSREAVSFAQMLEQIRDLGGYPTRERAEEAARAVLSALGRRLTGDERVELAACLPREAAQILAAEIPLSDSLTGWAFVKDIADRTGASLATTRWDVGSVLVVVARLAGPHLLDRILTQLPGGYAILFGRAELTPAA